MRAVKGELQHPRKLWQPERHEVNRYRQGASNALVRKCKKYLSGKVTICLQASTDSNLTWCCQEVN